MQQQPKLGENKSNPSVQSDRSRSVDALAASKGLALNMGQQVRAASKEVGKQAAPFIYEQSKEGFLEGLGEGFDSTANPFEGFSLDPDPDFFRFPQVGANGSLSPSSAQKALSPKN